MQGRSTSSADRYSLTAFTTVYPNNLMPVYNLLIQSPYLAQYRERQLMQPRLRSRAKVSIIQFSVPRCVTGLLMKL